MLDDELSEIEQIVSSIHLDDVGDKFIPYRLNSIRDTIFAIQSVGGKYETEEHNVSIIMSRAYTSSGVIYVIDRRFTDKKQKISSEFMYEENNPTRPSTHEGVKRIFESWALPVLMCDEFMRTLNKR